METSNSKKTPNSALVMQDKLGQAWSQMIDSISHDLINLLVITRMKGDTLQEVLPHLLKNYSATELPSSINTRKIKFLDEQYIKDFQKEITTMMDFLESLPKLSVQVSSTSPAVKSLSAKQCINELIEHYPLTAAQRRLITVDCNHDFTFLCAPIFIESLLYHLLDNALTRMNENDKGTITFWLTQDDNAHLLHMKDTGQALTHEATMRLFNQFFAKETDMPGPGFCRLALLHAGADVICDAKKDEYTHIQIRFPKIKTQ